MERNNPLLWTMALTAVASANVMAQTDVTSEITNPTFAGTSASAVDGWTISGFNAINGTVAESFCNGVRKEYNLTQKVTLPAGNYRLTGTAFYRQGTYENVISTENSTKDISKAVMFAGSHSVKVRPLASEAAGVYSDSKIYPNGMDTAADAFASGKYKNELVFTLDKEQEIEIGFKGTHDDNNSWFIVGSVKLESFGVDATSAIVNAGFESGMTGWTGDFGTYSKLDESAKKGWDKEGTTFCEKWVGPDLKLPNSDVHQDLNLPNGTYLLKARGQFQNQGSNTYADGFYLYAGDKTAPMKDGYGYSIIDNIEVTDGKLRIGAKVVDATGNWAHFDWVGLYLNPTCIEPIQKELTQKLAIVINKAANVEDEAIEDNLLAVSDLQVKINNMAFAEYKAYINKEEGNLASQIEEFDAMISNLVANKKQYDAATEAYATLADAKAALDAAFNASDKSLQETYDKSIAAYNQYKTDLETAYANKTAGTDFNDDAIEERISGLQKTLADATSAISTGNVNYADYNTVNTEVKAAKGAYTAASNALYAGLSGDAWQAVYGDWYSEALLKINAIRKDIVAVEQSNEAGKTATEADKTSSALKDANLTALIAAEEELQAVVDEYLNETTGKATITKANYEAACEDVDALSAEVDALYDKDKAPESAFEDAKALRTAIEELQAMVDAANVAHTIKGEAPFCEGYNEAVAEIETQIVALEKVVANYKANNEVVATIAGVQKMYTEAADAVKKLKSEDESYVVSSKFEKTAADIQTEIDKYTEAAAKAYSEGTSEAYKGTLNTASTETKIATYKANAETAVATYNIIVKDIAAYEEGLAKLDSVVTNPDVTEDGVINVGTTYGEYIAKAEKDIQTIETNFAAVLAKTDAEHFTALTGFAVVPEVEVLRLKDKYADDYTAWNNAQQEAAAGRMLAEAETRVADVQAKIEDGNYTYTEDAYGLKSGDLNERLGEIKNRLAKAADDVNTAAGAAPAEAIAILSTTVVNLNAIDADLAKLSTDAAGVKAEFDAEVAAYNEKVKEIAALNDKLNNEKTGVAAIYKDPTKADAFAAEIDAVQDEINALDAAIEEAREKEEVRKGNPDVKEGDEVIRGFDGRVTDLDAAIGKLLDSAKAAAANYDAKNALIASITAKDKSIPAAIATAKTEVAKVATDDALTYYNGVIAGYEKELGDEATPSGLYKAILDAYAKNEAVAKQQGLANSIKALLDNVNAVKGNADANENTYEAFVADQKSAADKWNALYERITTETEIQAEALQTYMDKLSAEKKKLDDVLAASKASWAKGTAVADEAAQRKVLEGVNTTLVSLDGSWEDDYNAEVAVYNKATYDEFNKKHEALKKAYSDAVTLIDKMSKTDYASGKADELKEFTDGIFSYATQIRTLKTEADSVYLATKAGSIYDENKEFAATADTYKEDIDSKFESYTTAINTIATETYETAYKEAEAQYAEAVAAVANFKDAVKKNAFATLEKVLDDAETASTKVDFAVNLDAILLDFSLFESKIAAEKETLAKAQYAAVIAEVDALVDAETKAIAGFYNEEGKTGSYSEAYKELVDGTVSQAKKEYAAIKEGSYFDVVTAGVLEKLSWYLNTIEGDTKHTAIYNDAEAADKAYHANDVAYAEMCEAIDKVQGELDALAAYAGSLLVAHNATVNERLVVAQAFIDACSLTADNSHEANGSVAAKENVDKELERISGIIEGDYKTVINEEFAAIAASVVTLMHDYDLAAATDLDNAEIDGYKTIIEAYSAANESLRKKFVDGEVADGATKPVYATAEETHEGYVALEENIGKTRAELVAIYEPALVESTMAELNAALAEVETEYDAIVAVLEECHDAVKAQFAEDVEAFKAAIDAEKAHIAEDADAILLYAENHKADIAAVAAMAAEYSEDYTLRESIENAEIPYDANDAAYAKLTAQLDDLQASLDKVVAVIADYEYKVLSADEDYEFSYEAENAWLSGLIEDESSQVKKAYDKVELDKNSSIDINWFTDQIANLEKNAANYNAEQYLEVAKEEFDEAVDLFDASNYSEKDGEQLREACSEIANKYLAIVNYNSSVYNTGRVNVDINGNKLDKYVEVAYMKAYEEVMEKVPALEALIDAFAADVASMKYERGDIDHSGRVDVNDYSYVRNILLGVTEVEEGSAAFFAADAKQDGEINIGDVTEIANKIMNGAFSNENVINVRVRPNFQGNTDAISVMTEGAGTHQRIIVALDNANDYVGCQMDIKLPAGVTVIGESLTSRANSHELLSNEFNGAHRIIVSALENNAFLSTESALIVLDVEVSAEYAGGNIEVSNAIFADAVSRTYKLADAVAGDVTGIKTLGTGEKVVSKIYSVGGQMMNTLRKGMNIIVNSDGSTQKVLKK